MSKYGKRKIINMALLMILSVLTITTYYVSNFSKAKKIEEVSLNIMKSSEENELDKTVKIMAEETSNAGVYYIELPEYIEGKKVKQYVYTVEKTKQEIKKEQKEEQKLEKQEEKEQKKEEKQEQREEENSNNSVDGNNVVAGEENIEEEKNEVTEEIKKEEIIETEKTETLEAAEEKIQKITLDPLNKLVLSKNQIKDKAVDIIAEYDEKKVDDKILFNQVISLKEEVNNENIEEDNLNIKIAGYMPENSTVEVEDVSAGKEIENVEKKYVDEKTYLKAAYDIKIMNDKSEYEPVDYKENVAVTIEGIDLREEEKYKIVHITDNNQMEEIEVTNTDVETGTLEFKAESFSTYAILAEQNDEGGTVMGWQGEIATKYAFGSGTQADPYLITSAEELAFLANRVNAGTYYNGQYFQLATDIDLKGQTWTPIGNTDRPFRGVFDGAGHTISNCVINTATTLPTNTILSYGFFGSMGGGTNTAIIRNVEFDNITLNFLPSGNISTATNTTRGWRMGIVAGGMYTRSQIQNCIVKNSKIQGTASTNAVVSVYTTQVAAGGIAGYASNAATTYTDPGGTNRYVIDNCFSDVDIDLHRITLTAQGRKHEYQYHVGGIIGTIRSMPVWPTNCLYTGTIVSYGMTGPIFGGVMTQSVNTTSEENTTNSRNKYRNTYFTPIWNGTSVTGYPSDITSYYTGYRVGQATNSTTSYTTSVTGTSSSRNGTSLANVSYFQGVNKGRYASSVSSRMANFNAVAAVNSTYLDWKADGSSLTFKSRFEASITEGANDTYTLSYTNDYVTSGITYKWYVNEELRNDLTTQTITQEKSLDTDYLLQALAYDGQYYAIGVYVIKQVPLYFNIIKDGTTLKGEFSGEGVNYVDLTQYSYEWYSYPDFTKAAERMTGVTGAILANPTENVEYELKAIYNGNTNLNRQDSYYNGVGEVIYINNQSGDDSKDGLTEATAVKTFSTAYSKLSSNANARNIIVVMGNCRGDTAYISSSTNTTTYNKKAILTGKYHGTDHSAAIAMNKRYLQNDTTFMYMEFNGGGNTGFLYCQGHSITIDEQVTMTNYSNMGTDIGYGTLGTGTIQFHLMGGVKDPSSNTLSASQNNNTLTIKSGTYGRIIVGGRNDNNPTTTLGKLDNPFTCTLNIDIQNSTKPDGTDYDVNLIVGGKNKGSIYGEITINANKGAIGRIVGANLGHNPGYNIPSNSFYGTTTINMNGASAQEICGSCMGRSQGRDVYFYGTINININGSAIAGNVYGGGLAGVTGYDSSSTDTYKDSYGKAYMTARGLAKTTSNITLNSGSVGGNIFGGGYGYSNILTSGYYVQDMGNMYGDTYITINGGTVTGNIYGAGEGVYQVSGYTQVAQMIGDTHIKVTAGTISGEIYGAGKGLDGYADIAKLTGNSNVEIASNVSKSVYGGAEIATVNGNTNVSIKNATYSASIYGGGNAGPVNGITNVTLEGATSAGVATTTTVADVYGGGLSANVTTSNVYIKTGTSASNVYGGGKSASVTTTNVYLQGGTAKEIYGGSNESGTVTTANVNATSGTATTIYGGNNVAGTVTTTNVNVAGGTITTAYGGGNKASTGTTNVNLTAGTVTDTYGGGKAANVTVKANVTLNGTTVTNNIYGGSNESGTVKETLVEIKQGAPKNVFGGNNVDGTSTTTVVNIKGGTSENVYGGGLKAATTTSTVNATAGTSGNIYGGGYQAKVTTTNVNLTGGTITNGFGGGESADVTTANITVNGTKVTGSIYGGSNKSGTVTGTLVKIQSTNGTIASVYGGNNVGGTTTTSNVQVTGGTVTNVYGGGFEASTGTTNVSLTGGTVINGFGGGASADVTIKTNITTGWATINGNIYGGSDQAGTVAETVVNINGGSPANVYGGNNVGGTATLTNVNMTDGSTTNVYGGGYQAESGTTNVNLTGGTITNGFGGGESANVTVKANITLNGTNLNTDGKIYGGSNQNGTVAETDVKIMQGYPAEVYGGNNLGGTVTTTNVSIQGGGITKVYGGGYSATSGTTNVFLTAGSVSNAFGGGASADVTTKANITLNGTTVYSNIYGGSDQLGTVAETLVTITQGSCTNVYGGNNVGGTATVTHVEMNNGTVQNIYGGGFQADSGITNVNLTGGTITNGFGGGESANVTVKANITSNGTTINNNIYGGSNQAGTVADTLVTISKGNPKNVYGGNNVGGTATVTHVEINGGTVPNVYGGGYQADSGTTNVNLTGGRITNGFGGGESANVTVKTNITLNEGTTVEGKIYGGSNQSGAVEETNVVIVKGYPEAVFGGNNLGGTAGTTNVIVQAGEIEEVYGGGFRAATTATNVSLNGGLVTNTFGGGQAANAGTTSVIVNGGRSTILYGGSNQEGVVTSSYVNVTTGEVLDVYGGNNAGGNTVDTEVIINLDVRNVYGGGNQARTTGNTSVLISAGTVGNNVYGGGNEAGTDGNTFVKISNTEINGSAFAGGNGQAAIVKGNSIIILEGTAKVAKDVFGGGNAAATGSTTQNSNVAVLITGGTVGGDVYGAANTSTVYGNTYTKIGKDAVIAYNSEYSDLVKGAICIEGTVFGGGKSNSAGAEEYDYSFESVIGNTYIDIDANGYSDTTDLEIKKSIFGSGNAATMTGYGYVNISNYGTATKMKDNVSIQRAHTVTIDNSHIYLEGTTDRTNAISTMDYSFNRINDLIIKNNTVLYLVSGANIVEKYTSLAADGTKATMTNVNNRLYMMEGQNFILETEAGNHGEVNGMTFFGVFTGKVGRATGIYGTGYSDGDTIPESADIFKRNSYVQGKNYTSYNDDGSVNVPHDINVDGFYTNYDEEGIIETKVIEPTPDRAVYYQWIAGKMSDDLFYDGIELIATKYATTATHVLTLSGLSYPNMTVDVESFDTSDLIRTVKFVDDATIPNIELDADKANSTFGLTMTAGNSGWQTNGVTEFFTDEDNRDVGISSGTTQFLSDNSDTTPTFSFYMGHSKNISSTEFMGTVTIKLKVTYVENDEIIMRNAYVTLTLSSNSTFKLANDFYEGAITPGKEYSMFATTPTNITSKSSFSAYYSLYLSDYSVEVDTGEYYDGFLLYDHWVVSSCILPAGTKITMIDSSVGTKKYYYYIVTDADETALMKEFPFSRFKAMGSTNEQYTADDQSGYLTSTLDSTKKISPHYNESLDLVFEEYILQLDFENANIPISLANQTMKIELRDSQQNDGTAKLAVNTDQYPMIFSVYSNKEAVKSVEATPSAEHIYMGGTFDVGIKTTYSFKTVNAETVYDTTYFEDALGLKVTVFNGGTQLTSSDLTGIYIEKNGTKYYARADGSYRIKLADAISNVLTNITFHTENGDLDSGAYTFNFDTFGSLDGVYFSSGIAHCDINVQIINTVYGLKAEYEENCKIVDKKTGKTLNNNNNMNFMVKYSGNFENPKIYVGLYRRKYDEVVSYDYELVNLETYVNETLTGAGMNNIYKVTDSPSSNGGEHEFNLTLKENLKSGTYKFTFMLYDGENYIGNVEDMVIIK